jgi:hypothetical protein
MVCSLPIMPPQENKAQRAATRLSSTCPACVTYVFSNTKLGSDALGSDQRAFYRFLQREPRLYDGTRSNYCLDKLTSPGAVTEIFCKLGSATVAEQFAQTNPPDALSETPTQHGKGMLTFFNPAIICKSPGTTSSGILNQATLFHEALHGFYGIMDRSLIGPSLLSVFGFGQLDSSLKITDYLEDNVLGGGASTCAN